MSARDTIEDGQGAAGGGSAAPRTRRALIGGVAAAGGLPAAAAAIAALAPAPAAAAGPAAPPRLPPRPWPWRVAVLGAGVAGMAAALAMRRAGWSVTVLEAEAGPGGRCVTLRPGDAVRESGNPAQRVEWDAAPHLYFNPGPARIPHGHRAVLGLCRELGVALEPLVNENRAALLHSDAAGAVPLRRVAADLRGTVAELAAKSLGRAALDAPFTDADLHALRAVLRGFGALDSDLRYRGSRRAGWAAPPGTEPPRALQPLDPRLLLDPAFWATAAFAEGVDYAATMLQPVGGMDRIAAALHAALGDAVLLGCEVVSLRRGGDGGRATVSWRQDGAAREAAFDRVLCTLPPPLLAELDTDFSPARRAGLRALGSHPAGKLAFHAARRFWEEDAAIYGGISWTTRDATQLWYPSHGFGAPGGGILVGSYVWDEGPALRFAARAPAERAAAAAADGEVLHPGYARAVAHPVSVSWPRMPRARGAWTEWTEAQRRDLYPVLRAPEGPYHFAGEHFSYLPGWQEGAVLSAWSALEGMAA